MQQEWLVTTLNHTRIGSKKLLKKVVFRLGFLAACYLLEHSDTNIA